MYAFRASGEENILGLPGRPDMNYQPRLEDQLRDEGYALEPRPVPSEIGALTWAYRRGKIADDFLFVFDGLDAHGFEAAFGRARRWSNQQYKMPKALRFRVPRTVCVLITGEVDGRLKRFVDTTKTRSVWGGEINHLLVLDRVRGRLHHQPVLGSVGRNELAIYGHVAFGERLLSAIT